MVLCTDESEVEGLRSRVAGISMLRVTNTVRLEGLIV